MHASDVFSILVCAKPSPCKAGKLMTFKILVLELGYGHSQKFILWRS